MAFGSEEILFENVDSSDLKRKIKYHPLTNTLLFFMFLVNTISVSNMISLDKSVPLWQFTIQMHLEIILPFFVDRSKETRACRFNRFESPLISDAILIVFFLLPSTCTLF